MKIKIKDDSYFEQFKKKCDEFFNNITKEEMVEMVKKRGYEVEEEE